MAIQTTTFKGARYIVKFHDPIEWSAEESYEAIESVKHNAFTYISKQPVPAGVEITNEDFWLLWADPNAQMEELRRLVSQYVDNVEELSGVVGDLSNELGAEVEARKIDIEKAHVFDTVADMKQGANLSVGAICHTNGFHAAGDGGAAWYEITDEGEANEMDVIACDELFAHLVITENSINPKILGAYGDGLHDDTLVFQAAIAKLQRGGALYIPIDNGEQYKITDTLVITTPYITIYSSAAYNLDWAQSGIIFEPSAIDSILFDIQSSGCRIENLRLETTAPYGNYKGIGIKAQLSDAPDTDIIVNDCSFIHFEIAIKHYDRGMKVNDCIFAECTTCIEINTAHLPNTGNNTMRGIIVCRNRFHQVIYCIKTINSMISTILVSENYLDAPPHLDSRSLTLIYTDSTSEINGGLISSNTILDSHDYCIDIEKNAFGLEISNNCFINRRGGNIEGFIKVGVFEHSSIVGNIFTTNLKNCIQIGTIKNSLISSNKMSFIGISSDANNKYSGIYIGTLMDVVSIADNMIIMYNANGLPISFNGTSEIQFARVTGNMSNRVALFNNINEVSTSTSVIQNNNIS